MSKHYVITTTNRFKKQYAKVSKQKNFKREEFQKVVNLLSNDETLPAKYKNHLLTPKDNRNLGMPYSTRCTIGIPKK